MEALKNHLQKYKIKPIEETKISSWQEYAIEIIEKFGIIKPYDKIIFKHAKNNRCYLEGKIALCVEKWGLEGCKGKGAYLTSLFRKKKPWES